MVQNDYNAWNKVFNAVAPLHPYRREIHAANAEQFGWELPVYMKPEKPSFKIVDGSKLIEKLHYTFKYPDPRTFYYEI